MAGKRRDAGDADEFGLDYDPSVFSRGLDKLVPDPLARWGITVGVETDREVYEPGEPVEIRVTISNRLPVPVTVRISGQRIWEWAVDGLVDASDEPLYAPDRDRSFSLRAGETRTLTRTWDGLIKRHGTPTRWAEPDRGEHEISASVSTEPPTTDSTTIHIR